MTRFLSLFAVLFLFSASEASACWPFCQRRPPSGLSQAVELSAMTRPTYQGIDTFARWGVTQAEARNLFDIAFRGRGANQNYESWLGSIGKAETSGGGIRYGTVLNARLEKKGNYDDILLESIPVGFMSLVTYGRNFDPIAPANSDDHADQFAEAIIAFGGREKIGRVYRFIDYSQKQYQPFKTALEATDDSQTRKDKLFDLAAHLTESKLVADFLNFTTVDARKIGRYVYVEFGPLQTIADAHDQTESQLQLESPMLQLGVRTSSVSGQPLIQSTIGLEDEENSIHGLDQKLLEHKEDSRKGSQEENPLLKDLK
jgi:hypothetical protein